MRSVVSSLYAMLASRLTPKVIVAGLALHIGAWLALDAASWATGERWRTGIAALRLTLGMLAYAVAFGLNLEIAREYRQSPKLRLAWLALAANSGIFFLRPLVETTLWNRIFPGYTSDPLEGLLLHLLIVPANCCILIGVLAMWSAYHEVGLGFRVMRRDYALMAGVIALGILLLFYRQHLTEAQSPYLASRVLQPVGLVLLGLCSAMSLALYRLAVQMDGGRLAAALRWLTIYVLLRGVLVLLRALKLEFLPEGVLWPERYLFEIGWQTVPWLAAMAAACRAELTVRAARELAQRRAARSIISAEC